MSKSHPMDKCLDAGESADARAAACRCTRGSS
jgi:hypothetical protein